MSAILASIGKWFVQVFLAWAAEKAWTALAAYKVHQENLAKFKADLATKLQTLKDAKTKDEQDKASDDIINNV